MTELRISRSLLERTRAGLRARSAGWRESACVWIGSRDGVVRDVVFHHELGDDRGSPLSLELPEDAKYALYDRLERERSALLALLHTHPADWVDLSAVDQRNQVSSRVGFWSIVLPHYGACEWRTGDIGFHRRCHRGWHRLSEDEVQASLSITETP